MLHVNLFRHARPPPTKGGGMRSIFQHQRDSLTQGHEEGQLSEAEFEDFEITTNQVPEVICNGESGRSWKKVKILPQTKKSRHPRNFNHRYSVLVSQPTSISSRKTDNDVTNNKQKRRRDKNMNEFPKKGKKSEFNIGKDGKMREQKENMLNNNGFLETECFWDNNETVNSGEDFSDGREFAIHVGTGKEKAVNGSTDKSVETGSHSSSEGGNFDGIVKEDEIWDEEEDSLHTTCTACSEPSVLSFRPCFKLHSQSLFTMSVLSLTVLILYVCIGTIMFHSIEQQGSVRVTSENDFLLFDFIQEWMERTYNAEYSNMTEFLAGALTQLRSNSSELEKFWQSKLGKETIWTWPNSLFYTFTVVTTIGYGNIVPTTDSGKLLTIVYGIFGVPLFLSCVSYWGEIVHQLLLQFEKWLLLQSKTLAKSLPTEFRKAIVISLFLLAFYAIFVVLAALVINIFHEDEMDFVTSCYFCYVTVSSIGFGDYTLLTYDDDLGTLLSYIAFICYVFLSAICLAGVVIFRVYSCNENYVVYAELS